MDELIQGVLNGRSRSVARLITRVENDEGAAETAVRQLHVHTGRAHVVGITGPPGCGKSTLVNELAKVMRRHDKSVGIIAVDPSSPFTGGAILGDRVRMADLAGDRGIFIRSLASRGSLGGLSQATTAVIKILDAAGFDIILVETVGAGQSEVAIAAAAHTTLVVEAPGMGDDIQTFKAGILEIADILVVNKADKPGADRSVKALKMMLHLGDGGSTRHHGRIMSTAAVAENSGSAWQTPVKATIANNGQGVAELATTIFAHRQFLQTHSEWQVRERDRSRREMEAILQARLWQRLRTTVPELAREQLITAVASRQIDPYTAVNELLLQMEKS